MLPKQYPYIVISGLKSRIVRTSETEFTLEINQGPDAMNMPSWRAHETYKPSHVNFPLYVILDSCKGAIEPANWDQIIISAGWDK